MDDLKIEVQGHGSVIVVRLTGMLARLEVYKLKTNLDALVSRGKHFLVLDLTDISYIDSAGIGLIVRLREQVVKVGGGVSLVAPQAVHAQRPLEIASVSNLVQTYRNEADALKEMNECFGLIAAPEPMPPPPPRPIPVYKADAEGATCLEDVINALRSMAGRLVTLEERVEILEKKPLSQ